MRRILVSLIALSVLFLPLSANAARKLREVAPSIHSMRLVVLTAPGCIYCRIFKRDIQPSYENSKHAADIPLVYIDINDEAADALQLKSPVSVVPTVVLVDGKREVSRVAGYLGPLNFFKAFEVMLTRR